MRETSKDFIVDILQKQKAFFRTHKTKNVQFRIEQLRKLRDVLTKNQDRIEQALWSDLKKCSQEAQLTEIMLVLNELDDHINHLESWAKPKQVSSPLHVQPSASKIIYEPLGVALIISPWNYPFNLLMNPLIGAISAGCCAIVKPSPDSKHLSLLIEELLSETFPEEFICTIQGGKETNQILLEQQFDFIFFTGSSRVGKVVMKAAAEHLTPVVLELGGKSPCIVEKDANLAVAARRIVWGKLMNAGQTCIAPDYLYVHESIKEELIKNMIAYTKKMYGDNLQASEFYPRIIHKEAFERLSDLTQNENIIQLGEPDKADLFFPFTILKDATKESKAMEEEIFGPVLPILTFTDINEPIEYINDNPKPLAFYYFGKSEQADSVLNKTTSGGACINDTLMHISNHNLPFGGIGYSGIGKYHGKQSFLSFSNSRSVLTTPTGIDLPFRYPPFNYFGVIKTLLKK